MKYFIIILLTIISFINTSSASVIVVANIQEDSLELSQQEIRNLFMGGKSHALTVVTLPPRNQVRILFNTKVIGLTESRIQSYWAQMRFSGRKKPPQELQSEEQLINYLLTNKNSISYLSSNTPIPQGLTVIYEIN